MAEDLVVDIEPAGFGAVQVGSGAAALEGSVPLHEFVAAAGTLTHAERMLIVEQALVLLEDNYVHLPLKSAMHAVNPVQRLRLLRARLGRQTDETMGSERVFHAELSAVFHSVRDLHTNYLVMSRRDGGSNLACSLSSRASKQPGMLYQATRAGTQLGKPSASASRSAS